MQLEPLNKNATISSLEIAQLTGKPHRNLTADIERILKEAEIDAQGYQDYTSKGYFKLIERPYEVKEVGGIGTGEFRVSATLKVTPAGVEFINRKLAA